MSGSSGTPGRNARKRGANYLGDIGKVGRRTGLTLTEGPRDEYGMEDANHLFTSPAKSTKSARSQRKSNATISSSEPMDVEDGDNAPDPRSALSSRSQARKSIPRSPFHRTNIGSSPRRHPSLDPRSSPRRRVDSSPSSHRSVTQLLDFSIDDPLPSVERHSPTRRRTPLAPGDEVESDSNRDVYSLANSPLAQRHVDRRQGGTRLSDDESAAHIDDFDEAPPPIEKDDDESSQPEEQEVEEEEETSVIRASQQPAKRGRLPKSKEAAAEPAVAKVNGDAVSASPEPSKPKRGRGRSKRSSIIDAATNPSADPDTSLMPPPVSPRLHGDQPYADAEGAPKNGAKGRPRGRPKRDPNALKEKDANARKAVKRTERAREDASAPRELRATSVPLQREQQLTPDADDGAVHTRSGRLAYKPLAYWKNERLEYDNDGRHGMQTIRSIVRMEERTPLKRTQHYRGGPRKKRRTKKNGYGIEVDEDDDEEEEEEEEEWEMEAGIMKGLVRGWDQEAGEPGDELVETELAFAGSRIETREVAGAMFRYAKMLTMPFFGSGMVELPPHGFKRMKNSRKMQMVFFVHAGKVLVEVAETQFRISKGGVWQVPRDNFYSITNETEREAKIFFAQGREVAPDSRVPASQEGPE